ncbi:hypothetical protein KLP28_07915 [Nocardioidaceae bacterium]|nr:hypothetical protein KLP28_07915 [Nocardioidaceae bacterium]
MDTPWVDAVNHCAYVIEADEMPLFRQLLVMEAYNELVEGRELDVPPVSVARMPIEDALDRASEAAEHLLAETIDAATRSRWMRALLFLQGAASS